MNMKNLILILVVVAAIIVLGGLGYWYWTKNAENTNTENINTTNTQVQVSLPPEAGDIPVNKSVTYKDVPVEVTTAAKTTEFQNKKAEAGTQYVVLYLAPTKASSPEEVLGWAQKDIRLVVDGREIVPDTVQIVAAASTEKAVGHFSFTVKDTDKDFTLQFGSGDAKKTIALGF